MENTGWLSLTEYALKNGVSISTLRRKIKSNSIVYKMEDGRYLIKSEAVAKAPTQPVFTQNSSDQRPAMSAPTSDLHWKALEARVAGLARKVDLMAEQVSELKMLVQIFEEKLEARE